MYAKINMIIYVLSNTNRKYSWKKANPVAHRVRNWCNQNSNYAIWIYKLTQ